MYDKFEENLNTEIYNIHKHLNIPFREIYEMPVMYRRDLVKIHNKEVQKENQKYEERKR